MLAKNLGLRIAGSIFGVVALMHLLRLVTAVPVLISGWLLPLWLNVVGCIVTSYLCFWLWKLAGIKEG
ncbi:MAG TPA: hypothetical protein VF298_08385 [Bacteroidales bacterium]